MSSAGTSVVGASPRRATKRQLAEVGKTSPAQNGSDGENVADENLRRSGRERSSVERYVPAVAHSKRVARLRHPPRFHITPVNEWHWLVKKMNISVRNTLEWRNGDDLPSPPVSCWLLPCKDDTAVEIAKYRDELRALGWKLLTCEPHVVSRIGQKANLHAYAKELGLLEHLPQHYATPQSAAYPCMLKAAVGEHGRDVFIVESEADVKEKATGGFASKKQGSDRWLLQELCAGHIEYATSLLVQEGEILDSISTSYHYDKEIYVWPHVEEVSARQHAHAAAALMSALPPSPLTLPSRSPHAPLTLPSRSPHRRTRASGARRRTSRQSTSRR